VQRMRELYSERHAALIAAGRAELEGLMDFSDPHFSAQVIGWLAAGVSEAELWRRAAARTIDTVPLASLTIERSMPPALVFGIGSADERATRTAMKRFGRVLRVFAWQTQGTRGIAHKVPTSSPIERRARPNQRNSGSAPTRGPQPGTTAIPRYR
jgi:hypothetical protein